MPYEIYTLQYFSTIPSIFQLPQIVPVEFCPSFLGMNQPATKDKETKVLKQETVCTHMSYGIIKSPKKLWRFARGHYITKPHNAFLEWKFLQITHIFALFNPPKMRNLMTPVCLLPWLIPLICRFGWRLDGTATWVVHRRRSTDPMSPWHDSCRAVGGRNRAPVDR